MGGNAASARRALMACAGMRSQAKPSTQSSTAGTRNPARHDTCTARKAVTTGASATPTLPQTPFTPIARPGRSAAASTSSAVPTGW